MISPLFQAELFLRWSFAHLLLRLGDVELRASLISICLFLVTVGLWNVRFCLCDATAARATCPDSAVRRSLLTSLSFTFFSPHCFHFWHFYVSTAAVCNLHKYTLRRSETHRLFFFFFFFILQPQFMVTCWGTFSGSDLWPLYDTS